MGEHWVAHLDHWRHWSVLNVLLYGESEAEEGEERVGGDGGVQIYVLGVSSYRDVCPGLIAVYTNEKAQNCKHTTLQG
jgi:hypothetical protein